MDSLTHLVLGAVIGAAVAPPRQRGRAVLAGAALQTLPDLDVLALAALRADDVESITWHRGPSHSLFVLVPAAFALWALAARWWTPARQAPGRWLLIVFLALLAHPLLDAFTVYGTQLLWPLSSPPVMWSTLFIIDPLLTLPLLVACTVALAMRAREATVRAWLLGGLVASGVYLGWSVLAKQIIERAADAALAQRGLERAPRFSVPMPFTTLLWRVVVMTPTGYLDGERSLVADRAPMTFEHHPIDVAALRSVAHVPGVSRLQWFTNGFLGAERRDGSVELSDLRMGVPRYYGFVYEVQGAPGEPQQVRRVSSIRADRELLAATWSRIWVDPRPAVR